MDTIYYGCLDNFYLDVAILFTLLVLILHCLFALSKWRRQIRALRVMSFAISKET